MGRAYRRSRSKSSPNAKTLEGLTDLKPNVRFRLATDVFAWDEAFQLVHDQYVARGYMTSHPSGRRVSLRHALPSTKLFVVRTRGQMIGTLSLIADSAIGLPMDELYGHELQAMRARGRTPAEVSALAIHPDYRSSGVVILMGLVRVMLIYAADVARLDDLCIVVNPRHVRFYQQVFGGVPFGGRKAYRRVNGAPAQALHLDLDDVRTLMAAVQAGRATAGVDRTLYGRAAYREAMRSLERDLPQSVVAANRVAELLLADDVLATVSPPERALVRATYREARSQAGGSVRIRETPRPPPEERRTLTALGSDRWRHAMATAATILLMLGPGSGDGPYRALDWVFDRAAGGAQEAYEWTLPDAQRGPGARSAMPRHPAFEIPGEGHPGPMSAVLLSAHAPGNREGRPHREVTRPGWQQRAESLSEWLRGPRPAWADLPQDRADRREKGFSQPTLSVVAPPAVDAADPSPGTALPDTREVESSTPLASATLAARPIEPPRPPPPAPRPVFEGVSGTVAWEVVNLHRETSQADGEIVYRYTLVLRDRSGVPLVIERNERTARQDGPDRLTTSTGFQRTDMPMYARLAPDTPLRLRDGVRAKARKMGFDSDSGRLDDLVVWHDLQARDDAGRPVRIVIRFRLEVLSG